MMKACMTQIQAANPGVLAKDVKDFCDKEINSPGRKADCGTYIPAAGKQCPPRGVRHSARRPGDAGVLRGPDINAEPVDFGETLLTNRRPVGCIACPIPALTR
jgi:hypothetical protein